jgi:hypothetical protein
MVVFGAASFIKPGFMPNYLSLAADYLRRPRCDVLEMIAQNKGVVGFNLIWCAVLPRHMQQKTGFEPRVQDVGQDGAHETDAGRHVPACASRFLRVLRCLRRCVTACCAAGEVAAAARRAHDAVRRRRAGAHSAPERENNGESAA